MKLILLERIIAAFGIIFLCIYLLYRICYIKSILPTQYEDLRHNVDPLIVEWRNKHAKVISGVVLSLLIIMIIIGMYGVVIPFGKDLRYIIGNDYPKFEGIVMDNIKRRSKKLIGQDVIISNGQEKIRIQIAADNLKKGDSVTVIYLPNLQIGALSE